MAKNARQRVLDAAKAELGVVEIPLGSNTGPMVRQYQNETWFANSTGWPWCVAFAWGWCVWKKALYPLKNPYRTASVAQLEKWARDNPDWLGSKPPRLGDLACLNHGRHVTIFEKDNKDGTFVGLGGNQRNMVTRSVYRISDISTLVRVPLPLHSSVQNNPAKPPVYEVVRGEGSRARVVFRNRSLNAATDAARKLLARGAKGLRIRRNKG